MKPNRKAASIYWPPAKRFDIRTPPRQKPISLELPVDVATEFFDLSKVAHSLKACRQHFAALELDWQYERKGSFGVARTHSVLRFDPVAGDIWTLIILEAASAGRHAHNGGGEYGEFIVTLAGQLKDVRDDGVPVRLGPGDVLFHAPDTVHEAYAPRFWVGLVHQPRGCTEVM